ncbi:MAG: TRAP transporter small permease subunit [Candidatus Caldatribacteriota bacterium]|jgi:TRAP-type mannitol/chloroaromatic compound transport system permease small subunit|nr:TRAP transporter small permease subunit [Atribacterota bacterium]
MLILKKMLKVIDSMSKLAVSGAKWFAWLLVLVGAYDTIARHFFNAPTIWAYDTLCMAGGALYVLGWAYDYLYDYHTRVDIIYRNLTPRKQALTNVICSLFLFFPLIGALLKISISWAIRAWRINETMISTFWYPPAAPYRTVFALGILLLLLQGIANFIRDLYFVIRGEPLDRT